MNPNGLTLVLCGSLIAIALAALLAVRMGKELMPDFNEGAIQVNLIAQPGISLEASRQLSQMADQQFRQFLVSEENPTGPIQWFTCKTGRAEDDEHVMGVNISEYIMTMAPGNRLSRDELFVKLQQAMVSVPGVQIETEQPIGHLMDHLLSGVTAQIAIKVFGDDLDTLRRTAKQIQSVVSRVPNIKPPIVESQRIIPQFRVEILPDRLAAYGLTSQQVNDFVETAIYGKKSGIVMQGNRQFDLLVRLDDPYRKDLRSLHRTPLELPDGRRILLGDVAHVYEGGGPNTIYREGGRRRIVVRVNTQDSGELSRVVEEIHQKIDQQVPLPEGYFITYGGDFEAQQQASRRILIVGAVALGLIFCVLYTAYPSASIVLQILLSLPTAFVGGMLALWLTGQIISVSAMVGFISLGGIAARNGLLLVSSYLTRSAQQGFSAETILESSLERLAPVLMTALTTGLGLLPLVLGGHLQGREILLPIATVLVGGLISSTLCEFLLRPGLFLHFSENSVNRFLANDATAGEVEFDNRAVSV